MPLFPDPLADLEEVFGWLGFRTRLYQNQSAEQIRDLMKELGQDQTHGDCFVCCVLSHGGKEKVVGRDVVDGPHDVKDVKEKQVVYGRDGKLCFIKEDILSPFNGLNCPSLVKKPKVFFIQACRGPGIQRPVEASAASLDIRPVEGYTLTEDADFLVSFATVEDYVSLVCPETGSWFIQSLCKQLKKGCPRCVMYCVTVFLMQFSISGFDIMHHNCIESRYVIDTLQEK